MTDNTNIHNLALKEGLIYKEFEIDEPQDLFEFAD